MFNSQSLELVDINPITDPIIMTSKSDDSIEYDFSHYEDPTLGFKSSNKSHLLTEVMYYIIGRFIINQNFEYLLNQLS